MKRLITFVASATLLTAASSLAVAAPHPEWHKGAHIAQADFQLVIFAVKADKFLDGIGYYLVHIDGYALFFVHDLSIRVIFKKRGFY